LQSRQINYLTAGISGNYAVNR